MSEAPVEGKQVQQSTNPGAPGGGGSTADVSGPQPGDSGRKLPTKQSRRRSWIYAVVAFAVVVVVILAAWTLTGGFSSKKSSGPTVLDPAGTYFTIPGDQFNAVTFISNTNATIQGTFTNTYGIILYTMNPVQFHHLVVSGNVSGEYEWTSGTVGRGVIYNLDITMAPGSWDLAFVNPSPINTTLVGFYSDLTLSES